MAEWVPAKDGFIEADVVRWTEAIWDNRKRSKKRGGKHRILGEMQVTGQIEEFQDEYALIKVAEASIKESRTRKPLAAYEAGEVIKKKITTLERGGAERLLWSDESARNALMEAKK